MKDDDLEMLLSEKASSLRESASDDYFTATVMGKLVTKHRVMQIGLIAMCGVGLCLFILNSIDLTELMSLRGNYFYGAEFAGFQINQFLILPLLIVFLWVLPMLEE